MKMKVLLLKYYGDVLFSLKFKQKYIIIREAFPIYQVPKFANVLFKLKDLLYYYLLKLCLSSTQPPKYKCYSYFIGFTTEVSPRLSD